MTDKETWTRVDSYIEGLLVDQDEALISALRSSEEAGLPAIAVSPAHGKLLYILARMQRPRRILEIGTLGGYSTIWLARALEPGGKLFTLEISEKHAAVARNNFERAGVADRVEVKLGRAIDSLPALSGPFDFVFIDADKESNSEYFQWALKLSRPGTVIVVDNVIRNGAVADASSTDEMVRGVQRLNEVMSHEPRVTVTEVQTVGVKGYDGFALALVG